MDKPNGHHTPELPPAEILAAGIPENALTVQRDPEAVLAEATRAAKALSAIIMAKPQPTRINGEIYLEFEDWQTLGRFFQVSASVIDGSTKYVEYGEVVGFEASAEALLLVGGRTVRVSAAEAMCLNDEWRWTDKPLFQLKSMAQTRACAKALRNVLAWVVVLAGFKPTPAAELDGEVEQPHVQAPRRRSEVRPEPAPPPRRQDPPRDRRPAPGEHYQQRFDPYTRRRPNRSSRGDIDRRFISDAQLNRMLAIARDAGVPKAEVNRIVSQFGFHQLQDITRDVYDEIVAQIREAA